MKRTGAAMLAAGLYLGLGLMLPAAAADGKPNIVLGCRACHQPERQVIRGKSNTLSEQFGTIHIDIGTLVRIVKLDKNTTVKCAESLAAITKDDDIAINYTGDEQDPVTTLISVKKPSVLPEEKLVSSEEMMALVALGPEAGGYLLVDSRPSAAHLEGHIPTALSIPLTALQKQQEAVLPEDKNRLIIFYCDGFTLALSPSSARVAEQLGYTNVKVFRAGMPAW